VQPSIRKDALECAKELTKNAAITDCTIRAGGTELAIIGVGKTQIKISIPRKRLVDTKFNCKTVANAALEIIDSCAECASDSCPVQGKRV
jgi:hypothetical protein